MLDFLDSSAYILRENVTLKGFQIVYIQIIYMFCEIGVVFVSEMEMNPI